MIPYKDNIPTRRAYSPVTIGLIVLNIVIFIYELTLGTGVDSFIGQFALQGNALNPLTVITYQFLHGGWLHVLGNMLYLWVFGNNIEDRLGSIPFLFFYIASGVVGGLLQAVIDPSGAAIIGASASVAGVLGAYLVWYPRAQVKVLLPIFILITTVTLPAALVLILWFVTNLFNGYASITSASVSDVAYLGHIGGFLFGALVAYLLPKPKNQVFYRE